MASIKKYSLALQKTIASRLTSLPKVETHDLSTQDFVVGLKKQIELALENGYNLVQIAGILKEDGVELSPSTLKVYLQKKKEKQKPSVRKSNTQPPPAQ